MSCLKYWVWLSTTNGVGPVVASRLIEHFGSPENVYQADASRYGEVCNVKSAIFLDLAKKNLEGANKILARCQQLNYKVISLQDAEYPERLRNIYDPPLVIYVRGKLPIIDEEVAVAIVGTRDCTPYGISSAENIGFLLAQHGLLVVTGLAKGIDTAAARGALRGGGRVVGVIGSGIDVVYPRGNTQLFDDVAASGAIVSEYPPGTPAFRSNFPARNRIISGLSLGVTVIEAPIRSGALITATRALEQGRDVFTLPGNVDMRSCEGSNLLLREGAIPVLTGEDIVNEYAELFPDKIHCKTNRDTGIPVADGEEYPVNLNYSMKKEHHNSKKGNKNDKIEIDNKTAVDYIDLGVILSALEGDEKTVAETIGAAVMHVDDITINSGLSTSQTLTALTMLEIGGYIEREGYGKWKISASTQRPTQNLRM